MDNCKHRALHNKDETGRDFMIESYVDATLAWYEFNLQDQQTLDGLFLDIGCDNGYALSKISKNTMFKGHIGVEPNIDTKLFDNVIEGDISNTNFNFLEDDPTHIFMNHVFEHLDTPLLDLLYLVKTNNIKSVFISTPDGNSKDKVWTCAPGHKWVFTEDYFSNILKLELNAKIHRKEKVTFRNNWTELWNLYIL